MPHGIGTIVKMPSMVGLDEHLHTRQKLSLVDVIHNK